MLVISVEWHLQISSRTLYVPWDEAGTLCPVGDFFNYACPGVPYNLPPTAQDTQMREGDLISEEDVDTSGGIEIRDRLRDGGFEDERGEYCFYARQDYQEGQQVSSATHSAAILKYVTFVVCKPNLHNIVLN